MRKRFNISLVFMLVLFVLLIGCSSSKETGNDEKPSDDQNEVSESTDEDADNVEDVNLDETLNVVMSSQPATLDTHRDTSEPAANIANHIFETLLSFDSNGDPQPMLAESWEYEDDNKELWFNLRQGVKFHNGNELTAADVKASIERWIENSAYSGKALQGTTVNEIDDYTVQLVFERPMGTVVDLFAHQRGDMLAIMPKSVIDEAEENVIKEYVGTGPFQMENWQQDQYIHLKRYEEYTPVELETDGLAGKKEALVKDLYFTFSTDSNTQLAGLLTNEYDVIYRITPDSIAQLDPNAPVTVESYPGGELNIYYNKAEGLFTDPKAREAVSLVFDSDAILQGLYSDPAYYTLEHNLMGSSQRWYSEVGKDRYNVRDVDRAKEILEEINYDGEEIVILASSDFKDQYNAGIIMQEQLQQAGFNVKLETYDWPTVFEMRQDPKNFDIHIQTQYTKPVPYIQPYIDSNNVGWTNDPNLDEIVDGLIEASDMNEAQTLYDDLQEWFYDYRPITLIGNFNVNIATADYVNNVQYYGTPVFWNVSVTK